MTWKIDMKDNTVKFGVYGVRAMMMVHGIFLAAEYSGQELLLEFWKRKLKTAEEGRRERFTKYLGTWRTRREGYTYNVFSFDACTKKPEVVWMLPTCLMALKADGEVCACLGDEWRSLLHMFEAYHFPEIFLEEDTVWFYEELVKLVMELFIENYTQNRWKAGQYASPDEDRKKFEEAALALAKALLANASPPDGIEAVPFDPITTEALQLLSKKQREADVIGPGRDMNAWHECRYMIMKLLGLC